MYHLFLVTFVSNRAALPCVIFAGCAHGLATLPGLKINRMSEIVRDQGIRWMSRRHLYSSQVRALGPRVEEYQRILDINWPTK